MSIECKISSFVKALENNNLKTCEEIMLSINIKLYGHILSSFICNSGNYNLMIILLNLGLDVNHEDILGYFPLITASEYGHLNIIKLLIKNGADIDKKNKSKETAIGIAYKFKHYNIVKFLVVSHANIDDIDKFNNSLIGKGMY